MQAKSPLSWYGWSVQLLSWIFLVMNTIIGLMNTMHLSPPYWVHECLKIANVCDRNTYSDIANHSLIMTRLKVPTSMPLTICYRSQSRRRCPMLTNHVAVATAVGSPGSLPGSICLGIHCGGHLFAIFSKGEKCYRISAARYVYNVNKAIFLTLRSSRTAVTAAAFSISTVTLSA